MSVGDQLGPTLVLHLVLSPPFPQDPGKTQVCVMMSAGAGDPETPGCPPRRVASVGTPGTEQINVLLSGSQTPRFR